jgi:hypothetical protein
MNAVLDEPGRTKTVGVVVKGPTRADEALRAALGLSLSGGLVIVAITSEARTTVEGAQPGSEMRRHLDTLLTLGHEVAFGQHGIDRVAAVADVIEVWT